MPEREAWKGGDLFAATQTTIPAYKYAEIPAIIGPGVLPSTNVTEVAKLHVSTRSRNAQSHLAVQENAPTMVAGQIGGSIIEDEPLDGHFLVDVPVRNYAPRPVLIPAGIPLGRFYRQGEKIVGEELAELVRDKEVYSDELILRYSDNHVRNARNLIGASLRFDSAIRMGILASDDVLDLSTVQGDDYRDKVDRNLVELPEPDEKSTSRTQLWIGNTAVELRLPERVDAVLRREVYSSPVVHDIAH
ncbi:hypothetical protein E6Q11_00605 [Candidatus Dojkabacteria bacterium]|uniref:Uncharacterized protein n=1 Tax=Candidatus Dojkabacteria bacterium TaxID=2099670 RepID=A0A5C7JAR2_9BACT|nr:MAG: hypothetical protein E6Q11_00605 [Candidatus Dojkabacteria bacterium]